MTDTATFLADAWVSVCATLSAIVVLIHLNDLVQRPEIARRFRFCLWLLVALMVARVGHWGSWGWLFSAVTNISAALLPLAALMLAEGLLRRHASPILKQICAGGALVFALIGLLQINSLEPWRIGGLLAFQLLGLGGVAGFVLRRDRDSLSPTENRTVNRMSLSFLLILPFLATDFMRVPEFDVPVRLGGVAVLVLCWLSIGMTRTGLRTRDTLQSFVVVFVMTGLLTLVLAGLAPIDLRSGVQVMAVILSTLILLAIWQAATALRIEDRQLVTLREIALAKGQGPDAALTLMRRAAGAPNAVLATEADLADMNVSELRTQFAAMPVQRLGGTGDEQINWLFSRFDATHAVMLSEVPLRIVMLNNPDIAAADSSGAALQAVQRMAGFLTGGEQG